MNLSDIKSVYFIGIGGIGMSALARYFHTKGCHVAGYDRTSTTLTRQLETEGMPVHYLDDPSLIPNHIDLVVYTPAVSTNLGELQHLRNRGIPIKKRAEVLGIISRGMKTVAIAGTHGKTTTSALSTWLMRCGGIDCTAFLGGIVRNFEANFVQGSSDWVVVEADEFDRSFLQLDPDLAVILSMDADHLDIYGTHENMINSGFQAFAERLKPGGTLYVQDRLKSYFSREPRFGIAAGQYYASQIRNEAGFAVFDYHSPEITLEGLRFTMPGRHNIENAVAAITVSLAAGANAEGIREGLATFAGIHRRFELVYRDADVVYIDDYAHHPTELEAAISATREFYPGRRITGIFQPHLFSRTQDFAAGFAAALDKLDEVLLMDIYPAREEPIPGVSSASIAALMKHDKLEMVTMDTVMEALKRHRPEVLLTLGAGDIDTMVAPIRAWLISLTSQRYE
jgi:UDP-N-acetylmuramate--alanine ligase